MEIYISEKDMPKSCSECRALMLIGGDYCSLLKQNIDIDINCPLKSLEQHDKEVIENFSNNNFVYKTTQGNEVNVTKIIRSQAIKEFAERLKNIASEDCETNYYAELVLKYERIDELVEEMTK